jgi:hypothetical protein
MLPVGVVQVEARKGRRERRQDALQSLGANVRQSERLEEVCEPNAFHGCVHAEGRVADGQVAFHFVLNQAFVDLELPLVDSPRPGKTEAYAVESLRERARNAG